MNKMINIDNIEQYATEFRDNVATSFAENYTENLDDFVSVTQVVNLIKSKVSKVNKAKEYLISASKLNEAFFELREWLYGVGLARLASRGYVDCAWDDQENTMIFWLADANQTSVSNKPK